MAFQEIDGQIESERKYIERLTVEDFGQSPVGKTRKFLWNLTEYPETSLGARVNIRKYIIKHFIHSTKSAFSTSLYERKCK